MEEVWVAVYEHRHGDDIRVFKTRESAEAWRRGVAKEWWSEAFAGEDAPEPFTDEHADRYFEVMGDRYGSEWFTITKEKIEQ